MASVRLRCRWRASPCHPCSHRHRRPCRPSARGGGRPRGASGLGLGCSLPPRQPSWPPAPPARRALAAGARLLVLLVLARPFFSGVKGDHALVASVKRGRAEGARCSRSGARAPRRGGDREKLRARGRERRAQVVLDRRSRRCFASLLRAPTPRRRRVLLAHLTSSFG